jgi:hypothetical protein
MSMRTAIAPLVFLGLTSIAGAETFGGFSGVDRPYLVNQDRVCTPIVVASGAAAGAPKCSKVAADTIAQLSIKPPRVQRGATAAFAAQASARTITVTRKTGAAVVAWDAPDPVVRIIEVYASQYDDRVAVAYVVRRAGKEVTDVVAFDLGPAHTPAAPDPVVEPVKPPVAAAPADLKLVKAMADARAAPKAKALVAWRAVLALDAAQPEALFRVAAAEVAAKQLPEALAALTALAASGKDDAIEWLIEARFDPAFAALRAEPKFRATVGLDRKPATTYERFLGFGGQWEQTGTSCDKPEVRFVATRDRHFKLRVKTNCEGTVFDTPFKGTWRVDGHRIVLALPNQGKVSAADEATCGFEVAGDEDAMRCTLGHDLDFVVLPTRRESLQ